MLLTLWIVAFALLISFYAVVLSFVVAGIGGLICTIPLFIANSPYTAVLMLGAALIGIGIAILFVVSVKPITVGIFKVCKASVNGIKRMFVKEK